jgi:hypothetical protein
LAIVSGLAPGNEAVTLIVGKSTSGKLATGNWKYVNTPMQNIVAMRRVVMIGLSMKIEERFMGDYHFL